MTRNAEDLYGGALALWRFLNRRQAGDVNVRLYSPDFEQDGWQSTHTVVEVVAEDMAFLVDSVRMAINRHGLTMHLVVHPVLRLRRDNDGELQELYDWSEARPTLLLEAVMQFEVDRLLDAERLAAVERDVRVALADVAAAVTD